MIKAICTSTQDHVDDLRKDIIGNNFNEELGFMHEIKKEVPIKYYSYDCPSVSEIPTYMYMYQARHKGER